MTLFGGSNGSLFQRGQPGGIVDDDGAVHDDAAPSGYNQYPNGAFVQSPAPGPTSGTAPFSYEIWARPLANAGGFAGGMIGDYTMGSSDSWNVGSGLYLNWPSLQVSFARAGWDNGADRDVLNGPALDEDAWSHVVATYDGQTMRIYKNGALADSLASTRNIDQGIGPVRVGMFRMDFGVTEYPGYFYGSLDEAAVYDYALSAEQVAEHYAAGVAPYQPPEQSYGTCSGTGMHASTPSACLSDPVNTLTGAFTHEVEDLSLPGTGVPFTWTRTYTSADTASSRLGPGWTDSYAVSLEIAGNGDVTLKGDEGQRVAYVELQDGSFQGAAGARSTLEAITGGYRLTRHDQVVYEFNAQGRVTSINDRNGQGVTLAYDGSGRLTTVTDAAGRNATVTYNASNLVGEVELEDGRSVSYGYTSGRLTSVTDVRGKSWTYTYDGGGRLATIIDPLSHTQATNVYGTDGRVTSQTDATGKTTTFAWDEETQTATVTDPNDNAWRDVYVNNVLVERTDPLEHTTTFSHDGDLNDTSVEGPTGDETTMTYDEAGNLLTATAPASLESVQKIFEYNSRNDPTEVIDARGKVTVYTYDTDGNLETVTLDGDQVASYTYDAAGRVETSTDGNAKTTTYDYDADGNLISVLQPDPDGAGPLEAPETTSTYDARGFMETRVDPRGNVSGGNPAQHTTSFTYDNAGNLLTETNPLGDAVQTNVYDDAGRLQSRTDANGHTTSYTYDNADRLLTETGPDPDGAGPKQASVTAYTYDDAGNKLTETDPRGSTTTFAYDDANRLVSRTGPDPDGGGPLTAPVTTYTFDANGNLASTVEPRGNLSGADPEDFRTEYTYDAAGRLLTTTDPLGSVTTNVYDPVGNLASVEDAKEHVTSYTYDAAGRILTVTAPDPDGGGSQAAPVTTYTYDDAGNLLTRTDANSHTTTYVYDGISRLVSETGPDPDGGGSQSAPVTTYTYDANGNRVSMTDPNGNATGTAGDGQTTYGYDRANRLTSIDYSDSTPDVTYSYDDAGNRLQMTDGPGTQTRTYDNLDRLLTVTRGTATFSYEYDAAGNITKRIYPDGKVADYTYDPLNRIATVSDGQHTVTYGYDAASDLVTTTLPSQNGYVETRTYDNAGRLVGVKSVKGANTLIDSQYTRDPVGNPLAETTTGASPVSKTFGYDNMDRLVSVCFQSDSCPGGSDPFIRWTYDGVGNRLTEERPSGTTAYSYDARDRLVSAGSTSYTYDENGNQLSGGSRSFTWDLGNRLKTTTLSPTTTTYTYDGDGIRTQASTGTTNQSKTNFTWDVNNQLPQIVREASGANSLYRRYFHGVDLLWMSTLENNSNAFYFHTDPLGSVRHITAQGGATQWTYDYEPFGTTRTQTGSTPTNLTKFTGEYLDPTGLYHLRARQYDSASGRLLVPDPIDRDVSEVSSSRYAYAFNRPTVFVDPSGQTYFPERGAQRWARYASSESDTSATNRSSTSSVEWRPAVLIYTAKVLVQAANKLDVAHSFPFYLDKWIVADGTIVHPKSRDPEARPGWMRFDQPGAWWVTRTVGRGTFRVQKWGCFEIGGYRIGQVVLHVDHRFLNFKRPKCKAR